jgi:hypothetical protein
MNPGTITAYRNGGAQKDFIKGKKFTNIVVFDTF